MPITAKTPLVKEDKEYPYYAINLAISPFWETNNVGASVSLRLTPYREVGDGTFETVQEESKSVVYLDAFKDAANDPDLAEAVQSINAALVKFIEAKEI